MSWSGCPMPTGKRSNTPVPGTAFSSRHEVLAVLGLAVLTQIFPASLTPLFPPAASPKPCIGALTRTRPAKAGCRPWGQLRLLGLLLLDRCRGEPGRARQDKQPSHFSSRSPGGTGGQAPAVSRGAPHAPRRCRGKGQGRCPGRAALPRPRPRGRARRPSALWPIRKIGRPASAARGGGGGCC